MNATLTNIYVDEHYLYIHLSVEEATRPCGLLWIQRKTKREDTFPLAEQDGEFVAKIPMSSVDDLLEVDRTIDLYVKEEDQTVRIRSEEPFLQKKYGWISETLIVPFTTKKGNVSIKRTDITVFAQFTHIQPVGNGSIHLHGIFVVPKPKLDPTCVRKADEPIQNPDSVHIRLKRSKTGDIVWTARPMIEKDGDVYRFQIVIDPTRDMGQLDIGRYTFLLQIQYPESLKTYKNPDSILESGSLKMVYGHPSFRLCKKTKNNHEKRKLSIYLSKKNRYVTLKLEEVSFRIFVRRQWIRFRNLSFTKKMYKFVFQLVGLFPANKKLIMFESFLGKQYSCNPRAIYEYIKTHYPSYQLYWSVDKRYIGNFEGKELKIAKRFSVKWLFLMATAKYWISNSRLPLWIPKPKHTIYLQTWHGTPLKRLAMDMEEVHMPGTNTEKYKKNFYKESRNWDYLISPNAYSSEIFRRAFRFEKEMIESGYPRNDFLYKGNHEQTIKDLKTRFQIPLDRKVILYAPTWRDDQFYSRGKYKFELQLDLNRMREELGKEYIILLRLHYLVAENLDLSGYEGFVYDFSNHEDIRELYVISDLLITDYSSVFFDYANLKRPMIFFVYDIEDYRDRLRGFYFDFEKKAPGPLVKTTEEVIGEIRKLEQNGSALPPNFDEFYERFCAWEDGEASKRVAEKILGGSAPQRSKVLMR
ncbi:CDP-glycerol glycerophosphotransferase family protein [Fervidibacillus halotolerans]|uniref:CDP-glycerol glycerophosphotransferase family protein n=1 Tax=Fervidibacillus halotolerans TaxID=2980027 RepID=A0A9E8M0L7_9BACI|nr:CDP-glycerol glycerophosphotransferase family protein [Fervidibacillus halotolerans]WAA12129.1 CDP-glycerol glycerophosphotransferase family protein [Fervidibacillus halotolerans]